MKYKKCPICSEKLKNGVCPMCGYDFKRLEYGKRREEAQHWDVKRHPSGKKKVKRSTKRSIKKGRGKSVMVVLTAVFFLLVEILPDVGGSLIEQVQQVRQTIEYKISGEKETTTTEKHSEPNPYLSAKYQLKTQGKHYEKVLTAGEYIVGLDLPEGIYQVSIQKGKNSLSIKNRKQSISQYDFYKIDAKADDNFYKTEEEVHLYQGSYVKIDQGGTMKFVTDCAQMDLMKHPAKNTLKKKIQMTEGKKTAGKDFPAGSYDVICMEGKGSIRTKYTPEGNSYEVSDAYEIEASPDQENIYAYPKKHRQIYFNKGMKVEVPQDMKIVLVPSTNTIPKEMKIYRYYESL